MRALVPLLLAFVALPAFAADMLPETEPRRSASEYGVAVARKIIAVAEHCATLPAPEGPDMQAAIADHCAKLPAPEGPDMQAAFADWCTRNDPLHHGAIAWRDDRYRAIANLRGEEVATIDARRFESDVTGIVLRGVARVSVDNKPDPARCREYVALIQRRGVDLDGHAEFGPLLQELAKAYPQSKAD